MLCHHRSTDIFPFSPCVKCRRSESRICAFILSKVHFPHLGFESAGVAPLPPRFRTFLDGTVKAIPFFPRVKHPLGCDDTCMLSVPLSTSGLHYRSWQSGEICQVLSTGAFTLFCAVVHGLTEDFLFFCVTFVLVSCSRVCLLRVSRLLGLTLRHFAPVCSCRWVSLTRWRLAIVQEAVRFICFCVFSIGPCT